MTDEVEKQPTAKKSVKEEPQTYVLINNNMADVIVGSGLDSFQMPAKSILEIDSSKVIPQEELPDGVTIVKKD